MPIHPRGVEEVAIESDPAVAAAKVSTLWRIARMQKRNFAEEKGVSSRRETRGNEQRRGGSHGRHHVDVPAVPESTAALRARTCDIAIESPTNIKTTSNDVKKAKHELKSSIDISRRPRTVRLDGSRKKETRVRMIRVDVCFLRGGSRDHRNYTHRSFTSKSIAASPPTLPRI